MTGPAPPAPSRQQYFAELLRKNPALLTGLQPRLNKYIPHIPTAKQFAALVPRHIHEVFYGGAAAGGKSDWLLMAALEYVDYPEYAGLILRRTFAQLDMPDSILDRAHKWLSPHKEVKWVTKKSRFEFPSGAVLQFGYLQFDRDVYQYDSAAYHFIGLDELTQFTEFQYTFMSGRIRRAKGCPIPLRLRAASNPGNVGHIWVNKRLVKYKGPGRLYVPARLEDNKHADQESYDRALNILDPVTRAQRRWGDWDVSGDGTVFKRDWFTRVVDNPPQGLRYCRYWDLAATLKDGDFMVGTKLGARDNGLWYVADVKRGQPGPGQVYATIRKTAEEDGEGVLVRFEQEGGAAGKVLAADFVQKLAGFNAKGEPSMKAKEIRWQPFANQAEHGNVILCTGDWNDDWIQEMCAVPQAEHDDQADSVSGAFKTLAIDAPGDYGVEFI